MGSAVMVRYAEEVAESVEESEDGKPPPLCHTPVLR